MQAEQENGDKKVLYGIIAALVTGSIALRLLDHAHFEQTTLLFIGIPAILAIIIIKYTDRPESAQGVVFKTITLFLLMSSILFGEGIVCVIFAAPIFYGVGALLTAIVEYFKKRNKDKLNLAILIPLIILLAEPLSYVRPPVIQSVSTAQVITGKASFEALNSTPDFNAAMPGLFKIGFPKPLDIQGQGISIGSTRAIRFESKTKGIGTLTLKVISRNKNEIIFEPIEDDTHIAHWLTWKKVKATLAPMENGQTKITWTSDYTCDLGPSWYFKPIEKIAVGKMNDHLINAYFGSN